MQDLFTPYEKVIQQHWAGNFEQIATYDKDLEPMIRHHFAVMGKLLRPMLTLAFFDLLGGLKRHSSINEAQKEPQEELHFPDAVIKAALAIEYLHNATLVHDDLQDGDELRRGHPTVWKAFSPYQAINAGSSLYFHTFRQLVTLQIPPQSIVTLLKITAEQALAIIGGQAAEKELWQKLDRQNFDDAYALYLDVVQKKTSALFALPMMTAAILAGEKEELIEQLPRIAAPLGALFQIQDDLLDLYGNKGREEKGSDIAEGKPSLPVLHFLCRAPQKESDELLQLIQTPREQTKRPKIDWAIEKIKERGGRQFSLETINRLRQEALDAAKELPLSVSTERFVAFIDATCDKMMKPIAHLFE